MGAGQTFFQRTLRPLPPRQTAPPQKQRGGTQTRLHHPRATTDDHRGAGADLREIRTDSGRPSRHGFGTLPRGAQETAIAGRTVRQQHCAGTDRKRDERADRRSVRRIRHHPTGRRIDRSGLPGTAAQRRRGRAQNPAALHREQNQARYLPDEVYRAQVREKLSGTGRDQHRRTDRRIFGNDRQRAGLHVRSVEHPAFRNDVQRRPDRAHPGRLHEIQLQETDRDGEGGRHHARHPAGPARCRARHTPDRRERGQRAADDDPTPRLFPRRSAPGQHLHPAGQRGRIHRLRHGRGAHTARHELPRGLCDRLRAPRQRPDVARPAGIVRQKILRTRRGDEIRNPPADDAVCGHSARADEFRGHDAKMRRRDRQIPIADTIRHLHADQSTRHARKVRRHAGSGPVAHAGDPALRQRGGQGQILAAQSSRATL